MLPDSNTKNGTAVSPGANRMSPGCTVRTWADGLILSICAGVRTGNAWVRASRALRVGSSVDMPLFSHRRQEAAAATLDQFRYAIWTSIRFGKSENREFSQRRRHVLRY